MGASREAAHNSTQSYCNTTGRTYFEGTTLAATGTRGRKYQAGAHLARFPARTGWFIRWTEPRGQALVISYTPAATDPQLDLATYFVTVRVAKTRRRIKWARGCSITTKPPASHPLHDHLGAGDCITHAGEKRIHTPEDWQHAIESYTGKQIGIRARRGKPGNVRRWKKAGDTRDQAEVALGQFLVNRDREKAGLPVNLTPAGYTFQQLTEEATGWAQSPQSGYSPRTLHVFIYILQRLARNWGQMPVADITPAMLGQWADKRGTEVTGGTLGNDIKVLRTVFKLAVARQYMTTNPTAGMKIPKQRAARPKYLTEEQIGLLLECAREEDARRVMPAASPHPGGIWASVAADRRKWYNTDGTFDAARLRFMLYSAMRKSQLTSLTWQQYDAKRGAIVLESRPDHTEKSKRVIVLPLPRDARRIIDGQPRGAPYIFPNLQGNRDVLIGNRMAHIFAAVQDRGGGHVHLHLLRHTALTALLRHTHDIAAVQRYAGHADVKTTARYAWVLDDELKAMTEDFNPMKGAGDRGAGKQ